MAKKKVEGTQQKTFGKRLAKLRKARGLSQVELAGKIGVTQRVVTYYERETPFPPTEILPALAKALNTTSDYLLGIDTKREEPQGPVIPKLAKKLKNAHKLSKEDQKALTLFLEALEAKQ